MNPPIGIMSGEKRGPTAELARTALGLLCKPYGWAVSWRNHRYDRGGGTVVRLDRPVLSIGNITTGGTGKTPVCIWLAERLLDMGLRPGVVSRGYRARKGQANDEMRLFSKRVPRAICVANPYRTAAAQFAIEECGAEVIVLDDGFQHRALGRDLDVVLIDSTRPFGFGRLLPRGLLREPLENLSRADLFVITRADLVSEAALREVADRLESVRPGAAVVRCRHRRTGFVDTGGDLCPEPEKGIREVFLTAGIGNPQAFAAAVEGEGMRIVGACWWPDHHDFRRKDADYIVRQAMRVGAEAIFTTEKDLVKLSALDVTWRVPAWAMRIEIEFLDEGSEVVLEHVRRTLEECGQNRNEP